MKICIYLDVENVDDALRVQKALKPWLMKIIKFTPNRVLINSRAAEHRKNMIVTNTPLGTHNIGSLHRSLRKQGKYVASYKTFQRDIYELIQEQRIIGVKLRGGSTRRTTKLSLPDFTEAT